MAQVLPGQPPHRKNSPKILRVDGAYLIAWRTSSCARKVACVRRLSRRPSCRYGNPNNEVGKESLQCGHLSLVTVDFLCSLHANRSASTCEDLGAMRSLPGNLASSGPYIWNLRNCHTKGASQRNSHLWMACHLVVSPSLRRPNIGIAKSQMHVIAGGDRCRRRE
jgi:hypothetical protein